MGAAPCVAQTWVQLCDSHASSDVVTQTLTHTYTYAHIHIHTQKTLRTHTHTLTYTYTHGKPSGAWMQD
jgi:hypothetical protein